MPQTLDYKTPPPRRLPLHPLAKATLSFGILGFPFCFLVATVIVDGADSIFPPRLAIFFYLAAEFGMPILTIILSIIARRKMLKSPDTAAFRPSMWVASIGIICAFAWSLLPLAVIYFGWVH